MLSVTTDYELVTAIWKTVESDLVDDSSPFVAADDSMIHLLAVDEKTLGVISVHQRFSRCWGIHVAFVPGRRAGVREALREAIEWLRRHTDAKCLMAIVDARKRRMRAVARVIGCHSLGILPLALDRDGGADAEVWVRSI